jgi:hypothetical protein
VVARWNGALDMRRMTRVLSGARAEELEQPERVLVAESHAGKLG